MKTLIFWYITFAVAVITVVLGAVISGILLVRDISAYNQCQGLPDEQFKICYTLAR